MEGAQACSISLNMVGGGVRRMVREGARGRVVTKSMKEMASNSMSGTRRSSSSSAKQAILSAKGEVGFKSVLIHLVLSVILIQNLPQ